jgi:transcriptional regulator with XRE-family HTH domain
MRDWRAIVGQNVRRLRTKKGLTQEQLAFEAKIDLTYVGGIERGERNPSLL